MNAQNSDIGPQTRALVVGLGRTGLSTVHVLAGRGVQVFATDEQAPSAILPQIKQLGSYGATFIMPGELTALLARIDMCVISPGVPMAGALARSIADAGVPIYSEIEIAYRLCRAPIIAVTGTKGKSTVTALIGHLLRSAGQSVHVGGNIGNPLIGEAVIATPQSWVVAEVSSFQLETVRDFRPRVSVLLNISADHLDRYESFEHYAQAKYAIFRNQTADDTFIGNLDDERIAALRPSARTLWFTAGRHRERATMFLDNGAIWYGPFQAQGQLHEMMRRSEIPLLGEHNVQNVLAALLACLAAGIDEPTLRAGVRTFAGMPHRLQLVEEIAGVRYIDDSKATNPGSVIAALRAFDEPVILIAGGKSKRTDFRELGRVASTRAKHLLLIGEAAEEIASCVNGPVVERARSMEDAVHRARQVARPGDVVLLSPACASFDMFASAEDRGEKFTAAVRALRDPARA